MWDTDVVFSVNHCALKRVNLMMINEITEDEKNAH